ncbi:AEC family transporter [Bacillus sp. HNG]|uniref:AEC family transporter n=1 Tax=Bacillus sp. HNG TaxID=2293325 RepID=UPI000E2F8B2F|nr:AEC family transporter [Bacillus sp. HNG]RFB12076.1 AEC family transporter [Bacillus sp. HNG]
MAFVQIILPVFLIFVVGYIGQKRIGFEVKSLSVMALYLMSPFLAFRTFYETTLNIKYFYMIIYAVALCLLLIIIVKIIGKIEKYSEPQVCGMILATSFMNNGNYGTPVALFAFGTVGLDYAVVLMVIQTFLMSTVGIYYAAKGGINNQGTKSAFLSIAKMPIVYGALFGLLFQVTNINLEGPFLQAIDFIANATIPTIMIVLGMQLASITVKGISIPKLSLALSIRLLISPIIALGIVFFLPIDPLLKSIMILMAAMPSAANTTMYSLQFQTEPELVSGSALFSTLLSLVTLPVILSILL